MKTKSENTATLGELVEAAFEEASHYTRDPKEAARLAARVVQHLTDQSRLRALVH
ncbi:hypothetical protein BH09MYX1_BH09MYX1_33970 [soil metagenome]